MNNDPKIAEQLKSLPEAPGIYQFFDAAGKILYVGKAKNLKNRVSSYFSKQLFENGKTRLLVKNIAHISWIVVNNELEALLLENTLIKKHQPRFNVMLKDDKTYPWICIKKEPFPRIFPTRQIVKDGSEYYGPYASVKMMRTVLDLCKQLYPIRTCNLNLTPENISKKKFKVCLEYHIGNCKGPCEGRQLEQEYLEMVNDIRQILKGNIQDLIRYQKQQMQLYAANYEFEQAHIIKLRLEQLEKFKQKTTVVNPDIDQVDVFSAKEDGNSIYINYLRILSGSIVQSHTLELKKRMDETPAELLSLGIFELRNMFQSQSNEIIVPFLPESEIPGVTYIIPQRGEKKTLLDLSYRNLEYFIQDKIKQLSIKDPEAHNRRILEQMMKDLRMQELPVHIECFDNSNFQGAYAVSAMVCFKNARPSKKDYRHFNVKTVQGPNDFDTMKEVLYRRYSRLLNEGGDLPQLIVIDGGKGQLGAAIEVLDQLGLRGKITVIGIAKRLEEIYYPEDPLPLYLDKKSETLKVIQHLRNEAHRFGITHYRKRHQKALIRSELESIKGIGNKTAETLLKKFKSVKRIKVTPIEELAEVIGIQKAQLVWTYFHSEIPNLKNDI
ncbi:MAG: excinuclease ABC subunit UvrC [Flavobacteriales bacterium]|nr:excinuclease ABC subunit UvrC [Flavobacteriales bacterium]